MASIHSAYLQLASGGGCLCRLHAHHMLCIMAVEGGWATCCSKAALPVSRRTSLHAERRLKTHGCLHLGCRAVQAVAPSVTGACRAARSVVLCLAAFER
eukprot:364189-Chlamydomonas_euryale.AAC.28